MDDYRQQQSNTNNTNNINDNNYVKKKSSGERPLFFAIYTITSPRVALSLRLR
jgi:hypothetical protein